MCLSRIPPSCHQNEVYYHIYQYVTSNFRGKYHAKVSLCQLADLLKDDCLCMSDFHRCLDLVLYDCQRSIAL